MTCIIWHYLQPNQDAQVVQLLQDGTSIHLITRRLGVSPSTVSRAWRRCQETDCYMRNAGKGIEEQQPSSRTRIYCKKKRGDHCQSPMIWTRAGCACGVLVSDQTVWNRLHDAGMRAKHPLVGPVPSTMQLDWHLPENNRIGLLSSQLRANSFWSHVTDWKESRDVMKNTYNIILHDRFGDGSVMQMQWALALMFPRPKSKWEPLRGFCVGATKATNKHHKISRSSLMPRSRSGRRSSRTPSHQKHAQMLSGGHTGTWGIHTLLTYIMSCRNEIHASWISP